MNQHLARRMSYFSACGISLILLLLLLLLLPLWCCNIQRTLRKLAVTSSRPFLAIQVTYLVIIQLLERRARRRRSSIEGAGKKTWE
jgi:hypothetical protein